MVDNHASRISGQPPEIGGKPRWISAVFIIVVFVGIIAALVLLT
jgi:hypothetical protein